MVEHLAIVLPGGGYGPLGPAIRLPRLAIEQVGAEVFDVEYPSLVPGDSASREQLNASVADQIRAALSESHPGRVTFLAKSLGTVVLSSLPDLPLPGSVKAIWLTPLFGQAAVGDGAIAKCWPSLLVAGAADAAHEPQRHDAVAQALGAASLILPGAGHLLEVPGDVFATLVGFRILTQTVLDFVAT